MKNNPDLELTSSENDNIQEEIPEMESLKLGKIVDCESVNVRQEPVIGNNIIATVPLGSEVCIDMSQSAEDFYKIYTVSGIEGFCMKKFITIIE